MSASGFSFVREVSMKFRDVDPRWTYQTVSDSVRRHTRGMEVLGAMLILFGIIALAFVVAASVASTFLIGALLLAAGVTQIAATIAYWQQRRGGYTLGLLQGCLCVIAGILCFTNPVRSLEVITFVLAVYFIGTGLVRLPMTLSERFPGWGWGALASAVDIFLGILILAWFPSTSLVVLGTFLGIQLIIAGTNAIFTGVAVRKFLEPPAETAPHRPATRFQH
jgi:uncharacterized membrane protein HdeD (DUF308 family)